MSSYLYITDVGGPLVMTRQGLDNDGNVVTEEKVNIGRYGVWEWCDGLGKHQCLATGDDLEALQAEHGPNLPVEPLFPQGSESKSTE